jgi:hypothetical protein
MGSGGPVRQPYSYSVPSPRTLFRNTSSDLEQHQNWRLDPVPYRRQYTNFSTAHFSCSINLGLNSNETKRFKLDWNFFSLVPQKCSVFTLYSVFGLLSCPGLQIRTRLDPNSHGSGFAWIRIRMDPDSHRSGFQWIRVILESWIRIRSRRGSNGALECLNAHYGGLEAQNEAADGL